MSKKILAVGITIFLFAFNVLPAYAGVREDLNELMEHVRKQEVVDDSKLRTAPPLELLGELRNYLTDPNQDVRMQALSQAIGIAQKSSSKWEIRQQVTGFILTVAQSDAEPSIAGYAAAIPYTFSPYFVRADFTDEMRQDILQLLQKENPRREFILLSGVADVQTAKERLQELSKPGSGGDSRAAHLALARMGVKDSIEHIVKEFESFNVTNEQSKIIKVTRLLKDISYVRQPAILEILIRYLFSNNVLPSEDIEYYPGTPYSQYALDLLAQIVEDFPIESEGPSYTEAEIKQARAWVKAHRTTMKIKR